MCTHRRSNASPEDSKSSSTIRTLFQKVLSRSFFIILGIGSTLWFLIRVIPKPSRASYPCMRVAAPLASTFVIYLLGLLASVAAFRKARLHLEHARYAAAFGLLIVAAVTGFWAFTQDNTPARAEFATLQLQANRPIGEAKGIFPGRVVWVHDADATAQNAPASEWFLSKYMNQTVVDKMVSDALQQLTGTTSDVAAWEAIFKFHNTTRGKGAVNYVKGEKILIKFNEVSGWGGNYNPNDLSIVANGTKGVSETSVASVLAVLRQLVNVVGADQQDIYIGDPIRHIYKHLYDAWHAEFPNIHYLDPSGYENLGREKAVVSTTAKIYYSDRGSILRPNVWYPNNPGGNDPIYNDALYTIFDDAEYLINIPMLKGHKRAGMTMFAKNHFGSHTRADASHLHNGLVAPVEDTTYSYRKGYGLYRLQVDIMSHPLLGKKNLVYIMDALWATVYETSRPVKWQMAPFNNDWTSSIFVSLDPVAIESVGYDFLRTEFTVARGLGSYPQMNGVDDYLRQAADSSNWSRGLVYDSNKDGIADFASLGTHEHWNNPVDKQYSRNLGTGNGIELIKIDKITSVAQNSNTAPLDFALMQNYPNPFNASTIIRYQVPSKSMVKLEIFNIMGEKVRTLVNEEQERGAHSTWWDGTTESGKSVASGAYVYRLQTTGTKGTLTQAKRLVLVK